MKKDKNGKRIPLSSEEQDAVKDLIAAAKNVSIIPPVGGTVLWFSGQGLENARAFQKRKLEAGCNHYKLIDDFLKDENDKPSPLLEELLERERKGEWHIVEEVWWILSERLAGNSVGDVHVFGIERKLRPDLPIEEQAIEFKDHPKSRSYYSRVFDKIERPVLEENEKIRRVFFNESLVYENGQWIDDED